MKQKKAAVRAERVEIEAGGERFLGQRKANQRLGKATGTENPEPLGVDADGPAEASFASAAEQFDNLLVGGIAKNHRLATTANERQSTLRVA